MKSRHSQRGMALVITLIMLAVVTLMAIAFLAVSRSQRAAVTVVQDQSDARLMAEAGLARAQVEIVGRMLAFSNRFAYDLMVSTNLINPNGFRPGVFNPTNVSYQYADGTPLSLADSRLNLANLFYAPRAPVFVVTNDATRAQEFRFYLDLNRNRRFETNGVQFVLDNNNRRVLGPGNRPLTNFMVGDPEWVGVLERPDRPHSATNRFTGRYAFLVLPAGKTLDLNYIHNRAKFDRTQPVMTATGDGFLRNQGVGSWELNLGGLLTDLNTNAWPAPTTPSVAGLRYAYTTNRSAANTGAGFDDAHQVLGHRYLFNANSLASVAGSLGTAGDLAMLRDGIDVLPSTVFATTVPPTNAILDLRGPWSGSDNPAAYTDVQQLLDPTRFSVAFTNRLRTVSRQNDTYDRYTYYRLLAQLGTDSAVASRQRLNLDYDNIHSAGTNYLPWTPLGFFTNAAERMLRTAYPFGLTNIQVYPTNFYTPEVHRTLQLAANIHEATTNRPFPSVFRPVYGKQGNAVFIRGYQEVTNQAQFLTLTARDLDVPLDRAALQPNDRVHGMPLIVGARKGLPNFNEFALQTVVTATRKLEIVKRDITVGPVPANLTTNQMYLLSISNRLGIEAANSYLANYTRPIEIRIRVDTTAVISNRVGRLFLVNLPPALLTTNFVTNLWRGGQFFVPLFRELQILPDAVFNPVKQQFVPVRGTPTFDTVAGFPVPEWDYYMTNRLTYVALDRDTGRILDYVTLGGLVSPMNITAKLQETGRRTGDAARSAGLADASFWNTNRSHGLLSPTIGITNQLYVSLNNVLSDADWLSSSGDPRAGQEKLKAVDGFRQFLGLPPLKADTKPEPNRDRAHQAPFSPTRKFYQEMKWQANDPLVHYTAADLSDPAGFTNPNNIISLKAQDAPTNSNLGLLNDRYSPWGGNPNKTPQPDIDYNLALKDPLVRRPDDWEFPRSKFATLGWLGRVHRGTPWQTVYLKSDAETPERWRKWSGSFDTHPTNDWRFLDLFTVAPNENAARGLMSVNQTNVAAWSALLSGVPVLSNSTPAGAGLSRFAKMDFAAHLVQPGSPQIHAIVKSVMEAQARQPNHVFNNLGSLLQARALTVDSPFLGTNANQRQFTISDEVYERIPQQVLSLLKPDEPRVVIYVFGQTLKPAAGSIVVAPGPFFQMCTNYQITGEAAVKAVMRFEDAPQTPRGVIESYQLLAPE